MHFAMWQFVRRTRGPEVIITWLLMTALTWEAGAYIIRLRSSLGIIQSKSQNEHAALICFHGTPQEEEVIRHTDEKTYAVRIVVLTQAVLTSSSMNMATIGKIVFFFQYEQCCIRLVLFGDFASDFW